MTWLRHFWHLDESRLRVRVYLHQGLDLDAANAFWSELLLVPVSQFHVPYRAVARAGIRTTKQLMGCPSVGLRSKPIHRSVMGLVGALLSSETVSLPG